MVVKIQKAKGTKNCAISKKLKFKDYENCLKATLLENKINQLEKNMVRTESLRENHNEFIKNNKLILKTQQSFKSERDNVFNEKVNKVALSGHGDKRIQSIDPVEAYAYGTRKDLIYKKQKTNSNNIIKQCKKKRLTLIMIQKKT